MAQKPSGERDSEAEQRQDEDSKKNREEDVRERLGLTLNPPSPLPRPDAQLISKTLKILAPSIEDKVVSLFVTVSYWNDVPFEIFLHTKDPASSANAEGLTRLCSMWLRSGGEIDEIVTQLRGISIGSTVAFNEGGARITSMCDAVAYVLDHNRTLGNPVEHKLHRTGE